MVEKFKGMLAAQYEASICMLNDCLEKCPDEHWDGMIGKWPFWLVGYHTLCFADLYLTRRKQDWQPRAIHPKGYAELVEEFPSRRILKGEMLEYAKFCRAKVGNAVGAETEKSLNGPSGFSWYKVTRGALHLINLRHISHHTGQLSAYLRKLEMRPRWVGSGWKRKSGAR